MKGVERRAFNVSNIELRAEGEGEDLTKKIVGHAAIFNQLSEDLGGFQEKIEPGAFSKSLKNADVRALWNHDANFILGRNKAGTLTLSEDKTGLAIEILPPDTQFARDLMVSMERGDVTQMSFGFRTIKDKWETEAGKDIRTLLEVEIFDVSPVTYPAYTQTDVALRSLDVWKKDNKPFTPSLKSYKRKLALANL
ncbi:MAG: HK97 family phage prohead protease [Rickettsiales bacterium]|nr:HK97 family phage prohead protease [Pseudomonadota bacterium]MDA0966874.1 HK97 family phage prohead protease [Pseudomonadota bacterium]MDG4543549.1 HK97 family phage prohead protease [Rickettsiales bacterium]MDG4545697.1 HK97 family phage prohead protease [Rickettsiales bacterium]MDG4547530.1 HK97 family phage prohead protease [Rickettsiales bacterium]